MDCGAIGERGIRRADLLGAAEQRRGAATAETHRNIAGDPAPRLDCAVEPAADRVEHAKLEMGDDIGWDGRQLEPGHPVSELRCDGGGRFLLHDTPYCTVSLRSVRDSSAASSTVMPSPGPAGGTTWPSFTTKSVCATSGSGPMTPRPKMNSPAGIT